MSHSPSRLVSTSAILAAVLMCVACDEPTGPSEQVVWDSTRIQLVQLYDAGFAGLHGGEGCSRFSNADGTLVWAESYLLHSLLDMFQATRDRRYLADFVEQAEEVAGATDVERNVEDYRGRSAVAWSSTRYSHDGVWAYWLVHDTLITEPLVRFAYLVEEEGFWWHRETADQFVRLAEEALEK